SSGTFAILGAVSVCYNIELVNGVDSKQLPAGSSRSDVDLRCSRVLDAIQQKQIFLRTMPGDGKHVANGGIGSSNSARPLRRIVHRRGIESDQLIVAAPIQRKILHLSF